MNIGMIMLNKMQKIFKPEKMYKFSIFGAVFNLLCAITAFYLTLPAIIVQIFIASGICFVIGGMGNWYILRIKNK